MDAVVGAAEAVAAVVVDAVAVVATRVLQWHLSEKCNLRCTHCYQETYGGDELGFDQWLEVIEQFRAWVGAGRGQITLSGGEPLLHPRFWDLLEVLASHRAWLRVGILTNGTLIDAQSAQRLGELHVRFVQVSMEGDQPTHDAIRGQGSFARTLAAITHLRRADIHTLVSFTAHRANYHTFPAVVQIAQEYGANRIWSDRLIPQGNGDRSLCLERAQMLDFFETMHQAKERARIDVALHRALQFLVGGSPYRCSAGDTLLTLMPNGDLYPCRRLPICVGNLLDSSLEEIHREDVLLRRLREGVSRGCESCAYERVCGGGLRCLSYALLGDPMIADPMCPLRGGSSVIPSRY